MIKVCSDFSGMGCFDEALKRLNIKHKVMFACDMDKYARQTYCANHGTEKDYELSKIPLPSNKSVLTGSKDPLLNKILKEKESINPKDFSFYYPANVYDREIPKESADIYMTSPPCQAFSLAGKRKGKDDLRGILFFNSLEFIQKNKPRYFIFENVKGLLSDNKKNSKDELGQTFTEWITLLGGKSVNGNTVMFPHEESVPYHIYWKVLNATDYGVPQNRERVFIIGIRDDSDNNFTWPKEIPLEKRLRDCLDDEVDEKYYLSEQMVDKLVLNSKGSSIGYINQDTQASQVFSEDGLMPNICAGTHGYALGYVNVKSATKKGYETATPEDSINLSHPNSETRRGRVGVGVAQTLDTHCNQGIIQLNNPIHSSDRVYCSEGNSPTLRTMQGGNNQPKICVPVLTPDRIEKRQNGRRFKEDGEPFFTLTSQDQHGVYYGFTIRRLTPRECLRIMGFDDNFKIVVSDTQAYKQAGNGIVVDVLAAIISKLKLF